MFNKMCSTNTGYKISLTYVARTFFREIIAFSVVLLVTAVHYIRLKPIGYSYINIKYVYEGHTSIILYSYNLSIWLHKINPIVYQNDLFLRHGGVIYHIEKYKCFIKQYKFNPELLSKGTDYLLYGIRNLCLMSAV